MMLVGLWALSGLFLFVMRRVGAVITMITTAAMVMLHSNVWSNDVFRDEDFSNFCKMGVVFASALLLYRHNA